MTATQITAELIRQGAQLRADGEDLTIRAPKMAVLPERGRLAEHKAGLLALLGNFSTGPVSLHPLSYGQKSLWFVYQLAPDSVAYNVVYAARISSEVNVLALRGAFEAVIERHPCLRTTYTAITGEPAQVVHDFGKLSLDVIQVANWTLEAVRDRMDKEADRPFDLEHDPVLRAHLFARSTNEYFLLITAHHIAVDAISIDVLTHDLCKFYNRESLSRLPLQYSDYVRWKVEMLASPRGDQLWEYWQKQLSGDLPVLNLPTDRRRPAMQTYRGAIHSFVLNADLTRSLKEVAKDNHTTLYMTVLAAFQVLLHRYTGQEDISVGSPMAGRSQADFAGIVGYFVNPVVMRVNLSGNPTFKVLLAHVRQTVLAAFEHADYPFSLLVERLHPDRDPSRSPLFQSAFVWSNYRQKPRGQDVQSSVSGKIPTQVASPKFELDPIGGGQQGSELDVVITIFEGEKSLAVQWRYNTDLFDVATIVRMTDHFQTLLEEIVANPQQRISELRMMTAAERQQLLVEWNDTKRDYSNDKCIHELIEKQAERTPNAVALVFEGKQLSYRELNRRASQLAHYLRRLGVAPDVLVGICVERSLEMVVGLLGILKAGGAYVPLDPAFPTERLTFMMKDAGLKAVVTQQKVRQDFSEPELQTVYLDSDCDRIAGESEENPTSSAIASNLAYVIYTSGSTGEPKGVEITHKAVGNFLSSMREQPGLAYRDVLLAVTTISFDIAGLELYLPLTVGGKVVIASREATADGIRLLQHMDQTRPTVMQATPATWRLLLESGWQGNKQLKILCGGEALPRELANQLIEKSSSLWNMYGPTETTIWSTVHKVSSTHGLVLVGRPIANTRIYILDRYREPTPIGVPGELCIGGAGVARGYLNRPELTEEKFIPDPFSHQPGARIYRTGDLARYLADGNIELLGRIDHQVKVRGFRIELGEIEAVLREHPVLRDAVVLAREDVPGDKRLVGYVVAANPPPTTDELRSFLQQKLPDYMVPGVFVFLEALPLTPNQKVDRRALPAPDTARPALKSVFVAPESRVEKTLAEIWLAVLGVERLGIHDNFFDLGGHSLLMAKAHSQLIRALGRDIPMVELFRYPTISALAEHLNDASGQRSLQPISSRAEKQRLALQHQQQRMQAIARLRGTGRQGS